MHASSERACAQRAVPSALQGVASSTTSKSPPDAVANAAADEEEEPELFKTDDFRMSCMKVRECKT